MTVTSLQDKCLHCQKKLRQKYHTTWRSTGKKPRACGGTINDGTWEHKRCKSKDIYKNGASNWECRECRWTTSGRKEIASRTPFYDKLGQYGDGFFCNKSCGYAFGVNVAKKIRPPAKLELVPGRKLLKIVVTPSPSCCCAGPNYDPDKPCPVPGHVKLLGHGRPVG